MTPEINPAVAALEHHDSDVPSSPSASNAPKIAPGHDGNKIAHSNPGFTGWAGLNFEDQRSADGGNQFSLEPPDQGLCVGNGIVLEAVNTVMAMYSTTTGAKLTGNQALNPFFFNGQHEIDRTPGAAAPFGTFTSDPKCYYDPALGRFFLTLLTIDQDPVSGAFTGRTDLRIAVSKNNSPAITAGGLFDASDWYFYNVDTTNDGQNGTQDHHCAPPADATGLARPNSCLGDQPLIGADTYGFFVTTNEFELFGNGFNGTQVYAFDKAALTSGELRFQLLDGTPIPLEEGPAYSLQPATSPTPVWDESNNGTEYMMSALEFDGTFDNRIAVWAFTNTQSLLTTPAVSYTHKTLSSIRYGAPPPATQKKGPIALGAAVGEPENLLNSNDDRMNQVVYAAGKLWSGLNTVIGTDNGASSKTNRVGIAYFIVSPSANGGIADGTIVKQGYVSVKNNDNVMFPSIGVNAAGKGVMTFTLSGQQYFPSSAYAPIDATNGAGDVHIAAAGVVPADGFTGYAAFGGNGVERWGDYSAAVADASGNVWLASEWIPGSLFPRLANWGTFISKVQP